MSSQDRGFMIAEAVSAMNFEYHLKLLARERDRRTKRKKKKEAVVAATTATSKDLVNKPINGYTKEKGRCQV